MESNFLKFMQRCAARNNIKYNQKPLAKDYDNIVYLHNDTRFVQYRKIINICRPAVWVKPTKSAHKQTLIKLT